jgi:hypothetical protein
MICLLFTMPMMVNRTKTIQLWNTLSSQQQIFGGLLVNMDTLGNWLSWLEYISIFRYANKVLVFFYIQRNSLIPLRAGTVHQRAKRNGFLRSEWAL